MSNENSDKSLDISGLGKVANAVPKEGWIEIIQTASDTFKKCLAPITATTEGIGRLIEYKFDTLIVRLTPIFRPLA